MAHHSIRFPLDVALGAQGGPMRATDIVTLVSGAEERSQRWFASRRRYDARYGVKSRADMQSVLNFFEERRGRFHSFLWHDALDYSTAHPGEAISATDQIIGTGDGERAQFQLVKTYGSDFDPYQRKISKPINSTLRVALDAIEVGAPDYSLDDETGLITFVIAPASGVTITAGFEFDVPVRFDMDHLDIALNSFSAADIPSIPLIEVLT